MKYTMTIGSTRRRFLLQQFFSINFLSTNKLADHFGWFSGFSKISFSNKIEYHWTDRSKVCVINIWKIKMWVDQIVRLSEPIIVVCAFFFWRRYPRVVMFSKFLLPWNRVFRYNYSSFRAGHHGMCFFSEDAIQE